MNLKFKHFVILQVLDVLTTYFGLTFLGLREANTFASGLFQEYGLIFALVGMKVIGLMVIYTLIFIDPLKIKNTSYKNICLNIMCLIFVIVVLNNSYQMIRVI